LWRKELQEDSHFFYGYGTQIISPKNPGADWPHSEHRRHPRTVFKRKVRIVADHTISDSLAVDISHSGVFVKSGKQLQTGQIITMRIPDKTGGDMVVRGRVVWSNTYGFGLKFVGD
jgi:hypothetical protein